MGRTIFVIGLTVLYALIPTLCRAGALSGCCDDSQGPSSVAVYLATHLCGSVVLEGMASDACPVLPHSGESSGDRDCGACAGVCVGAVKPSDVNGAGDALLHPCLLVVAVGNGADAAGMGASYLAAMETSSGRLRLPAALSDIPLLI